MCLHQSQKHHNYLLQNLYIQLFLIHHILHHYLYLRYNCHHSHNNLQHNYMYRHHLLHGHFPMVWSVVGSTLTFAHSCARVKTAPVQCSKEDCCIFSDGPQWTVLQIYVQSVSEPILQPHKSRVFINFREFCRMGLIPEASSQSPWDLSRASIGPNRVILTCSITS